MRLRFLWGMREMAWRVGLSPIGQFFLKGGGVGLDLPSVALSPFFGDDSSVTGADGVSVVSTAVTSMTSVFADWAALEAASG